MSAVTVSGWTSLGSGPLLIEARSSCGLWLVDAATTPTENVKTGDIYLAGGDKLAAIASGTLWARPGASAASAIAGVMSQTTVGSGGADVIVDPLPTVSSGTVSGRVVPKTAGLTVTLHKSPTDFASATTATTDENGVWSVAIAGLATGDIITASASVPLSGGGTVTIINVSTATIMTDDRVMSDALVMHDLG